MIGRNASASGEYAIEDLPGSSGRTDVLLRCIRAALLCSHGIRRDVRVYLVLCGGAKAPRTVRVDGQTARFVRPDERSLALLVKKTLARAPEGTTPHFVEIKPGVAVANGGLPCVMADVGPVARYVLEEDAPDLRGAQPGLAASGVFFLGDHLGFEEDTRAELTRLGAEPVSVGPVSLHSEDVVAIVTNEIDRLRAAPPAPPVATGERA